MISVCGGGEEAVGVIKVVTVRTEVVMMLVIKGMVLDVGWVGSPVLVGTIVVVDEAGPVVVDTEVEQEEEEEGGGGG